MIYNIVFLIITIFIFIRVLAYALYEIREKNNRVGGISIILLSIVSVICSNIIMWIT